MGALKDLKMSYPKTTAKREAELNSQAVGEVRPDPSIIGVASAMPATKNPELQETR